MANQCYCKIVCGIFILLNVTFPTIKGESNEACGPADDGVFYAHPNCEKYYECSGGHEFIRECPPGTYWNQDMHRCDHPANVPECVGGTRPPSGGSTSSTQSSTTRESATTPPNSSSTTALTTSTTNPETSSSTDAATTSASPTPLPNGCPLEGVDKIPYPGSCVLYFICIDGNPYLTNCTGGLYFNPDTKECDRPENVNCTEAGLELLVKSVSVDLMK